MKELENFKEEQERLNKLRNEDYKKLKVLMNDYCGFTNMITNREPNYINLWCINSFIEDFESKVIVSIGKQKENGQKHLKTLYEIQLQYGKYYFESIIYREKVKELETNQLVFLDRIKELQKENELLKKLENF